MLLLLKICFYLTIINHSSVNAVGFYGHVSGLLLSPSSAVTGKLLGETKHETTQTAVVHGRPAIQYLASNRPTCLDAHLDKMIVRLKEFLSAFLFCSARKFKYSDTYPFQVVL